MKNDIPKEKQTIPKLYITAKEAYEQWKADPEKVKIIDVRTPEEYRAGHIQGARNIPLDQIKAKSAELKKTGKPIITCCRSGARSGMAKSQLASAGIEVYNGGAWNTLNQKIS